MASEVRVNQIQNQSGLGTVTFYNSGQVFSGITTVPSLYVTTVNDGPISGTRNRIINGDFRIDQRNAGVSVTPTTGQYTLDRWYSAMPVTSKYSVIRSGTAPTGFTSSFLATSLSAYTVGASETFNVQQVIEGYNVADLAWGTSSAQTVTISFWVRSSLTGTFGGSIQNATSNRSYPFSYSINSSNTFEYKTLTIPGDTTGTWPTDNTGSITLIFSLGTGSTLSGTAGSWSGNGYRSVTGATSVVGTNGATFYLTGVQLEAGTTATAFERRSYGQELALCQRYCYATYAPGVANSANQLVSLITGSTTRIPIPATPVQMRGTPSLTVYTSASGGGSGTLVEFSSGTTKTVSSTNINGPCGGGYHDITSLSNPVIYYGLFTAEL